jgi:hypothetical protein
MKKHIIVKSMLVAFLLISPASAGSNAFDTEKMLSDLEQQLQLSREKYNKMKPQLEQTLEQKSRELKETVDKQVKEGFVELESMSKKLYAASDEAKRNLEKALNSDEIMQLKNFLASIDEEAIRDAREKLLDELTRQLELTADQLDKLKPILRDYMIQATELLEQFTKGGKRAFEEYREKYDVLANDAKESTKDILNSDQMKKLEEQLIETRDRIEEKVFTTGEKG